MFELSKMFELVNLGYLNFQKHPIHDLFIFNYSKTAQFEKYWNEITLASRGLVINSKNELIARCLPKFFNYQELDVSQIPKSSFKVYEKLDGSYLQIFKYRDEIIFSSRGSFTSDQAIKAKEIFYKKYSHLADQILPGYNYIFEIIYPANRIVVDYGDREDLIMITVINNLTKEDRLIDIGFPMVKEFPFTDFETILNMHIDNAEGMILKFDTLNDIDPKRLKSKFAEYVRLHRVLTNCSNRDIWNLLRSNGNLEELLDRVPDEFYDWVQNTIDKLRDDYFKVEEYCLTVHKPLYLLKILRDLNCVIDKDKIINKKVAAAYIYKHKYRGVLFNMFYGMEYSHLIWEIVEPEWEKPFNMKFQSSSEDDN